MFPSYKSVKFWNMVKYSFLGIGIPAEAISFLAEAPANIKVIIGVVTVGGLVIAHLISIWMVDSDNNGEVDIFEDKK